MSGKKPKPIMRYRREWARCWTAPEGTRLVSIRVLPRPTVLLNLKAARRLRDWLDRAIAWMEDGRPESSG